MAALCGERMPPRWICQLPVLSVHAHASGRTRLDHSRPLVGAGPLTRGAAADPPRLAALDQPGYERARVIPKLIPQFWSDLSATLGAQISRQYVVPR